MNMRDELEGLRHLLRALDNRNMTIRDRGKDVTKQEADKLRQDIAHLETVLARARGANA
jgi:uncharacterized membrane protein